MPGLGGGGRSGPSPSETEDYVSKWLTPKLATFVKEFVAARRGRVWLEALPGYAPDLNPWDEGGWHHLKNVEMRNMACRDLEELHEEFHLAVGCLRQKPQMVQSFFAQAGLTI